MNSFIRNNWLFELLAVALIAYLLAKMSSNLVVVKLASAPKVAATLAKPPPSEPLALSPVEYADISTRNIFNSASVGLTEEATDGEPERTPRTLSGEPIESRLAIQVMSTFSVGDGKDSRSNAMVVTSGKGKEGEVKSVGDEVQNGVNLEQILQDRIIVANNGQLEYILLDDLLGKGKSGGSAPSRRESASGRSAARTEPETEPVQSEDGSKFTIARTEIDKLLENPADLYTQIRAVPSYKDGKSSGLKLLSIKADSIFSKLGLKRGDVLEQINQQELDIQKGLELFNSLKNESNFTLTLLRRGKKMTLEYEVR